MWGTNAKMHPPRTTWANDVEKRLKELAEKRRELEAQEHEAKSTCNHTLPNGSSTYEPVYDDHDDVYFERCRVCGS